MASTAILAVKIISDSRGAVAGIDSTSGKLGKMGNVAKKAGFALAAGTAVGAKALWDATQSAGDLQQSIGAVDSVFGKSAGKMHTWAKGAATDVGLTANEFNELGTLIGSQLKNGGTAMDELGPKTRNLIKTGADLSSMFGGTTKEAVEALSSALKGERDPIEKYGVSLNQAKIDAEAASLGFKKVKGALSAEAQQAATLSLIMKQTGDAHGNFAKESDTLAHQQQVLGARLGNLKDQIGTALLPVVTKATAGVSSFVAGMQDGTGAGGKFAAGLGFVRDNLGTIAPVVGTLVAGLGLYKVATLAAGAASAIQAAGTTAATGATWSLNAALRANPIGLVVTALSALGAGLVLAYKKSETFRNIVNGAWRGIRAATVAVFGVVRAIITRTWDAIRAVFGKVLPIIGKIVKTYFTAYKAIIVTTFNAVKSVVSAVWGAIKTIITRNVAAVKKTIEGVKAVVGIVRNAFEAARDAISDKLTAAVTLVRGVKDKFTGALSGLVAEMKAIGGNIIQGLVDGIRAGIHLVEQAVRDLAGKIPGPIKKLLGINSPSRVFRDIGMDTGKGYVEGLRAQHRAALKATTGLIAVPDAPRLDAAARRVGRAASSSTRTSTSQAPVRVEVNFTGLVTDKVGVAREIRKVLLDADLLTGAVS